MKKRQLGSTGIAVTPVGFGVLTIGRNQLNLSLEEGAAILRHGLERGIELLDTAQYYETYPYIRAVLRGGAYDPVIMTKSYQSSYLGMTEAIEEARREMDRDVVDVFLLHEVRSENDFKERAGAWDCLLNAREKGLIKAIGVSTHHVDVAEVISTNQEADVLFPLINLTGLGIRKANGSGSREEMERAIRIAADNGKGVLAMKVFGGGLLLDRYQDAYRYASSLYGIASSMVGFGSIEEVDRMIELVEGTLAGEYLPDLSKKRIRIDQSDCIACYACMERCPNAAIFINEQGLAEIDANCCLSCGYCGPVCPVRAIILL